jgi:hypothetical protein
MKVLKIKISNFNLPVQNVETFYNTRLFIKNYAVNFKIFGQRSEMACFLVNFVAALQ